tara:strand:+ start:124 stop:228 length:105 start_codon:yes stop_codon:yes gene_type:complete
MNEPTDTASDEVLKQNQDKYLKMIEDNAYESQRN